MAGETIQQLFRYVEEKVVGLEMLLKHGLGYSKPYDSQLYKSIDFNSIDSLIFEQCSLEAIDHIYFLEKKFLKIYMDDESIGKLANMCDLEFSTHVQMVNEIKHDLNSYIKKLKFYKQVLQRKNDNGPKKGRFLETIIDYLFTLEIDHTGLFDYDTNDEGNLIKKSLQKFLNKNFQSIQPKLNLITPSKKERYAYYIIRYLAEKNSIGFNEIENVSINGSDYHPEKMYQHNSKLKSQIKNKIVPAHFSHFIEAFEAGLSMHIE